MNKYHKYIVIGGMLLASLGMYSCQDYLDRDEESIVNAEDAFKNFRNFQGFTEELYYCIPLFHGNYWQSDFNWGEDEIIVAGSTWFMGYKVDNGDFWGWQKEYDGWGANWMDGTGTTTNDDRTQKRMWPLMWYGIRKANLGIANLDKLVDATEEEKDLIEGQLYFFRGWFHFMLMQYFGGLPYIDHVLEANGESYKLPRLSYQQTADKAAYDFRHAADLLPLDWDTTDAGLATYGKNRQRINKIMALGYLGKNYLWAGSPLMNYESTGSREYNAEYCKKAAEAFAELLMNCKEYGGNANYSLVEFDASGDNKNSGYSSIFYSYESDLLPGGTEAIFQAPCYDSGATRWGMVLQYSPGVLQDGSSNCFSPTANYVNYYGMQNGLPIKADGAGPDDGYFPGNEFDPNHPWKDRDPRFYHDIVYDGVECVDKPSEKRKPHKYANLYTGGSYMDDDSGSRTGYLLYKFLPHPYNINNDDWGHNKTHIVSISYMRLADVYLMYAEAVANGYGTPDSKSVNMNLTAVGAVNKVRDRAHVEDVNQIFLGNTEEFMKEVRRERAVELAFEGHRFNDLRRWLLLTEYPYTLKTRHNFTRVGNAYESGNSRENEISNLKEEVILERKLEPKHYWMPLKRVDTSIYLEFEQNPGW